MLRLSACLLVAALLSGCELLLGDTRTVQFSTPAPLTSRDEGIIAARLREHPSGYFPRAGFARSGDRTSIEAVGAPSEQVIRFLLSHRGRLEARSEAGSLWFAGPDVVDAVATFDDQKRAALSLKLTDAAGARLAALSAQAAGTLLRVDLDGETLTVARLAGPIPGGMLQMTLNKTPQEILLITTVLKTGPLDAAPQSIDIKAGR